MLPAKGFEKAREAPSVAGPAFSTLAEAKSVANNFEIIRAHLPYDTVVNGFCVQFRSDIDGVRYVIIDERDHDMTGWKIETSGGRGRRVQAFERERWFCSDNGVFDCFGFGSAELREPWSALCDHGERIVRWIPPDTISE